MRITLALFMMLLLLNTLSGWTQSSKWVVLKSNTADTIIQYNFSKTDLQALRLRMALFETYAEENQLNREIIAVQKKELNFYQELVINKDSAIKYYQRNIDEYQRINAILNSEILEKPKHKIRWPYWLGGGIIGGFTLCLLLK